MAVGTYLAGVLIALATTFGNALGLSLQKKVHMRLGALRERALTEGGEQGARDTKLLRSFRQPMWVAGILLMAVASITSLAVFALLGQAVASSFSAVTILWNLLLSWLWLGEQVTWLDGLVSVILVTGSILAVYFGSKGNSSSGFFSPEEMRDLWSRPLAISMACVIVAFMTLLAVCIRVLTAKRQKKGVGTEPGQVSPRTVQGTVFLCLFFAGLASGWTGTCAKGFVSLISWSIDGNSASAVAGYVGFWMLGFALLTALYLQISFLNSALKDGDATFVVPQYQAWIVVFGVVFGYIFFEEARGKSAGDITGFILGVLLIVSGIGLLMAKKPVHKLEVTEGGGASPGQAASRRRGTYSIGWGSGTEGEALMNMSQAVQLLLKAHLPMSVRLRRVASAPGGLQTFSTLHIAHPPHTMARGPLPLHKDVPDFSRGRTAMSLHRPASTRSQTLRVVVEYDGQPKKRPDPSHPHLALTSQTSKLQTASEEAVRVVWDPQPCVSPAAIGEQPDAGVHSPSMPQPGPGHKRRRTTEYLLKGPATGVPPCVALQVHIPVLPRVHSEPSLDARYRRTMATAAVAHWYPACPRPLPTTAPATQVAVDAGEPSGQPTGEASIDARPAISGQVLPMHDPGGRYAVHAARRPNTRAHLPRQGILGRRPAGPLLHESGSPVMQSNPNGATAASRRVRLVPVVIVPPSITVPLTVVRNLSISPSILAAVLRSEPGSAEQRQ